jgi:hypothetical protein
MGELWKKIVDKTARFPQGHMAFSGPKCGLRIMNSDDLGSILEEARREFPNNENFDEWAHPIQDYFCVLNKWFEKWFGEDE